MAKDVLNKIDEVDDLSLENTVDVSTENGFNDIRVKTGIGRHWCEEVDKPEYVQWLTPLSKAVPVTLHYVDKQGEKVCRKSKLLTADPENTECEYCVMPDKWNPEKKNRSYAALIMLAYCFGLVGRVGTVKEKGDKTKPKLGEDGKPITFDYNPICIITLKRGKDDTNITILKDLDRDGDLCSELFELRKHPQKAKKPMSAAIASKKLVEKSFKHLPDGCTVPKDIVERFEEMDKKDVRGILINPYVEDWENPVLLKHVNKPSEDPKYAKEEKDTAENLDG